VSKKTAIVKLSKQFGNNNAGETAGFTPEVAAHIVKNEGGKLLAEIDPKTERYDESAGKIVSLKAPEPKPKQ
jgi:hypothetical protein